MTLLEWNIFPVIGGANARTHSSGQKLSGTRRYSLGDGKSFQPAIVAARLDLITCDIAPSARMSFGTPLQL